jgi:hypothetical protein
VEGKGSISHDFPDWSSGVAGVSQINGAAMQMMPARSLEHRADRNAAARLLLANPTGIEGLDRPRGRLIYLTRRFAIQVVTQVGADHKTGFVASPQFVYYLADLLRADLARKERNNYELLQYDLQERQLHFERMLGRVGLVPDANAEWFVK